MEHEGRESRESGQSSVTVSPANPFSNLEALRLSQDFTALAAVEKVLTSIPVRRPKKKEFIRVRPGSECRFDTFCLTDEDDNEVYLVTPELQPLLGPDVRATTLFTCMSRSSQVPFLWPIYLPDADGRLNSWPRSARKIAELAQTKWLKVTSDHDIQAYVPEVALGNLPEPEWPAELEMKDLIELAFGDRFIGDWDHPVLRRLRGEM